MMSMKPSRWADRILVMRDGAIAFEHRKTDRTASIERRALLAELGVLAAPISEDSAKDSLQ